MRPPGDIMGWVGLGSAYYQELFLQMASHSDRMAPFLDSPPLPLKVFFLWCWNPNKTHVSFSEIFDGPRETLDKTYQNGSKAPEQRHISIITMFVFCCHALLISQPQPPHTLLEKSSSVSMLLEVDQPTWVGGVVVTDRRSLRSILFHHINITQCPRTGPTCDAIVACLAVRSPWLSLSQNI